MLAAYIFCLVLGGGFLAVSILGDVFEGADAIELDVDADFDADLDAGGADGALKILSLRTIVYALFGFGAVGSLLTLTWGGDRTGLTLAFASGGAVATGLIASAFFGFLKRSDTGDRLGDESFVGLAGKVTLPLSGEVAGQVTLRRGDRMYTLRALPHESAAQAEAEHGTEVIVVEMDQGTARVVPVTDDLRLQSES